MVDLDKGNYIDINCDEHLCKIIDLLERIGIEYYFRDDIELENVDFIYFGDTSLINFTTNIRGCKNMMILFERGDNYRSILKDYTAINRVSFKELISYEKQTS